METNRVYVINLDEDKYIVGHEVQDYSHHPSLMENDVIVTEDFYRSIVELLNAGIRLRYIDGDIADSGNHLAEVLQYCERRIQQSGETARKALKTIVVLGIERYYLQIDAENINVLSAFIFSKKPKMKLLSSNNKYVTLDKSIAYRLLEEYTEYRKKVYDLEEKSIDYIKQLNKVHLVVKQTDQICLELENLGNDFRD